MITSGKKSAAVAGTVIACIFGLVSIANASPNSPSNASATVSGSLSGVPVGIVSGIGIGLFASGVSVVVVSVETVGSVVKYTFECVENGSRVTVDFSEAFAKSFAGNLSDAFTTVATSSGVYFVDNQNKVRAFVPNEKAVDLFLDKKVGD